MKLMKYNLIINLPPFCETFVWYNNSGQYIKIYNKIGNKRFIFIISKNKKNNMNLDKWGNSIIFKKVKILQHKILLENKFNSFLKSINIFYFKKIKFKGKGFRIKFLKKNKIIKFYFGKSHMTFILVKKIIKKRINKYKFILKSVNKKNIYKISKLITNIKIFNFYTLRGLRLSRQIIFKRKGKKGTYI